MKSIICLLCSVYVIGCAHSSPRTELGPTSQNAGAATKDPEAPRSAPSAFTSTNPRALTREPTVEERAFIDELARSAEKIRHLRFSKPVAVRVMNDVAITESLLSQLKKNDIEEARTLYTALGLLPKDIDLYGMLSSVLLEQVVGYYDPDAAQLVIRDDIIDGLRADSTSDQSNDARLVLVHELVHALQDQRLDLGKQHAKKRSSDEENAFRSVVEGDATFAMMAHLFRTRGIPLRAFSQGVANGVPFDAASNGKSLNDAPPIVRITLVAPYVRGMAWAATLHNRGEWRAIDNAHRAIPVSTEQILHPSKYLSHETPLPISIPPMPFMTDAGFKTVKEDTLGELELSVYFGQREANGIDANAASNWDGDRVRVYADGRGHAVVVGFTAWDTEAQAKIALERAVQVAPTADQPWQRRSGRFVLIIRGASAKNAMEITKAFQAWTAGHSE
ncbi:MAG: hypothetical protein R3A47_11515 [Polyangiales bacterium]